MSLWPSVGYPQNTGRMGDILIRPRGPVGCHTVDGEMEIFDSPPVHMARRRIIEPTVRNFCKISCSDGLFKVDEEEWGAWFSHQIPPTMDDHATDGELATPKYLHSMFLPNVRFRAGIGDEMANVGQNQDGPVFPHQICMPTRPHHVVRMTTREVRDRSPNRRRRGARKKGVAIDSDAKTLPMLSCAQLVGKCDIHRRGRPRV